MLNNKIRFDDAYQVQGLKYNLLSVTQYDYLGHKLELQNIKVKIYDYEGNLIGTMMQMRGKLFYLDPSVETYLLVKVENV